MAQLPADPDDLRRYARDVIAAGLPADHVVRIDSWSRYADPTFSRHLSDAGLIGLTWPRRYGGGERSHLDRLVVTEELLRSGAPVAGHWMGDRQIGPAVLRYGSDELKEEIVPPIVRSESVFCLGMSEPEAGSDLASVRTRAKRVDGGWRLEGHKIWTGQAHHATHAYVLARTDPDAPKHSGLTEFLVDMDTDGVEVLPILDLTGAHFFNEVRFDGVVVPDRRVLGTVDNGWKQVVDQLSFERGGPERYLSTLPLFDLLVERRAIEPAVLGELVADLATLRSSACEVARAFDGGAAPVTASASLKLLGNRFERRVVESARSAVQEVGDLGELVATAALIAPAFSIRGGAADVLMSIVAKQESLR